MKQPISTSTVRSGDAAYKCVVTAVNGTSPGLAASISYNVETFGEPVFIKMQNTQPSNARPSLTHRIVAATVGTLGWIVVRNGEAKLQLAEGIYVGTCEEAAV